MKKYKRLKPMLDTLYSVLLFSHCLCLLLETVMGYFYNKTQKCNHQFLSRDATYDDEISKATLSITGN